MAGKVKRLQVIMAMSVFAICGCKTLGEPDQLSSDNRFSGEKRGSVADPRALALSQPLGRALRLRPASHTEFAAPSDLRAGRFFFPDYQDPNLVARIDAAVLDRFEGRIEFHPSSSLSYTIQGERHLNWQIKRKVRATVDEEAGNYAMTRRGRDGKWRPDYARIAKTAELSLDPTAVAAVKRLGGAPRDLVAAIARQIQSIPYGIPPNGFLYPDEVLKFNYGDCDSKSVLAASLMRHLAPDLDYIFVDLPSADHLLMGVAVSPNPGDDVITVKGETYVLVEMAGPARLPLGKVARQSRGAIRDASSHVILSSGRTAAL